MHKFLKFIFGIGLYIFWRFADRASQYIYLGNLMHKIFVLQ